MATNSALSDKELLRLMMDQVNEIDVFNEHAKYISETVLPSTSHLLLIARGEIIRLSNENERLRAQLTGQQDTHTGAGSGDGRR